MLRCVATTMPMSMHHRHTLAACFLTLVLWDAGPCKPGLDAAPGEMLDDDEKERLDALIEDVEESKPPGSQRPLDDPQIFGNWQVAYTSTRKAPRQDGQREHLGHLTLCCAIRHDVTGQRPVHCLQRPMGPADDCSMCADPINCSCSCWRPVSGAPRQTAVPHNAAVPEHHPAQYSDEQGWLPAAGPAGWICGPPRQL